MSTINAPLTTTNILINTLTQRKVVYLPAASTVGSGKMYFIKDICGNAARSTVTISTIGFDTLESRNITSTTSAVLNTNFQSVLLSSDGVLNWMVLQNYNANAVQIPFIPSMIPNLSLWLDPSQSNTLTLSSPSFTVSQIADRSSSNQPFSLFAGLGNNIITTSTLNGLSTLYLSTATLRSVSNFPWRSKFVSFMVANAQAASVLVSQVGVTYCNYVFTANNGLMYVNATRTWNDSVRPVGTPIVSTNTWFLLTLGYNNATTGFPYAVNGVARTTTTATSVGNATITQPVYINGRADLAGRDNTHLAEFLFYQSTMTQFQAQQVEGYLSWKWGLQDNLPANHPFKNRRPYVSGS